MKTKTRQRRNTARKNKPGRKESPFNGFQVDHNVRRQREAMRARVRLGRTIIYPDVAFDIAQRIQRQTPVYSVEVIG